jgi:ethanolaminephosphotransferase
MIPIRGENVAVVRSERKSNDMVHAFPCIAVALLRLDPAVYAFRGFMSAHMMPPVALPEPKPFSPTFNFSPYLPPDAAARLGSYVYRSEDRSLVYKHFWRPLCRTSVNWLPLWLAPNVITVTALLLVIFVHIGFVWYMPNITNSVNYNLRATAIVPVSTQEHQIFAGVPFGSPAFEKLRTIFQLDFPGSPAAPVWLFVAGGVCLILYQYLDNLDGHQARRTGMSSPLGLLMDHGCDAINCVIGSLSIATALGTGPTWKSWSVVSSAVIVFFCNTWEEYYRGALVLPIINAPNEGLLLAAALYIVTSFTGTVFWLQYLSVPVDVLPSWVPEAFQSIRFYANGHQTNLYNELLNPQEDPTQPATFGVMLNTAFTVFMLAGATATAIGNVLCVFRCVRGTRPGEAEAHGKYATGWLLRHFPFIHALTRLLPLAVLTVMANIWVYTSPNAIFRAHPRVACWTFGLLYTKLAVHLMVAHLCETEFHPLRRTLIPFMYCGLHWLLTMFTRFWTNDAASSPFWGDESMLLTEFLVISVITYLHCMFNVTVEMATALKVPIFTVPLQKQRAALDAIRAEAAKKKE